MAKVILNTKTNVNKSGTDIGIYTYYTDLVEFIIAFIKGENENINGVDFLQGEEGYTIDGYPDVSFFINTKGELVVNSDLPERFEINSDGQLTITE